MNECRFADADGSTVTIELKRLSNFLTNEQLNPNRVICGETY